MKLRTGPTAIDNNTKFIIHMVHVLTVRNELEQLEKGQSDLAVEIRVFSDEPALCMAQNNAHLHKVLKRQLLSLVSIEFSE